MVHSNITFTTGSKKTLLSVVILSLFLFTCCLAQDPPPKPKFPKIATTYSTFISYNDFILGFTYAFKEYHNENLQMSRLEDANITIVDSSQPTRIHYWWSAHPTNTTSCTKSNDTMNNWEPSFKAFLTNKTEIDFKEYRVIDRGINCSVFESLYSDDVFANQTTQVVTFDKFNLNLSKSYLSVANCLDPLNNVTDTDNVTLSCTNPDAGTQINCVFTVNATITSTCAMNNNTSFTTIATFGNVVVPATTTNVPVNTMHIELTVLYFLTADTLLPIRATSNGVTTVNNVSTPINRSFDWVDFIPTTTQQPDLYKFPTTCVENNTNVIWPKLSEKVLLPPAATFYFADQGEFSALFEPILNGTPSDSIVWRYDASNNYQSIEIDTPIGDQITVFNDSNGDSFTINTYSKKCKSGAVTHPFRANARNQAIYNVMTNTYNNFAFKSNNTVRRGVNVDEWEGKFEDGNYNYTISVFLFNQGWKFPGRYGVSNNTIIPLAIQVVTWDSVAKDQTTDIWDIFYYVIEDIPNSYITKESMRCLPELPTNYTSLVYVNYGEVGSSFSYFETVYSDLKQVTTQGKFTSFHTISFISFANNLYSEWLPNGTQCKIYTLPDINKNYFEKVSHAPSLDVFYSMAEEFGPVEYVGTVYEQSFNVTQFKTTTPELVLVNRSGVQYQETKTAYLNWIPGSNLPHSVHFLIKYREKDQPTTEKTFNIYVYWSMFTSNQTSLKNYTTPKSCENTNKTAPDGYLISNTTYNLPVLTNSTKTPIVPNHFSAYIEVKTKQANGTYLITPIQWQYSEVNKVEIFTFYDPVTYTPNKYKYCYKTKMGGQAKLIVNGKSIGTASSNYSPLYQIGDGQLVQLFYQPELISKSKMSQDYQLDKGVPGETYTYQTGNTSSVFMFYPDGWKLFGEKVDSRIPLTLLRNSDKGITEVWNFYRFSNDDLDSDITKGCEFNVTEYVGGLNAGIIAAIIIVVAVCFIGITAIVVVVIRKKRQLKQQPPHILLDDRNLINSNEINRVYEN